LLSLVHTVRWEAVVRPHDRAKRTEGLGLGRLNSWRERDQRLRRSPIWPGASNSLGEQRSDPPIGQAASDHALENVSGAVGVGLVLGRIAHVELRKVAVHVRLRPVVIRPDHAALEDGKEVSNLHFDPHRRVIAALRPGARRAVDPGTLELL